MEKLSTASGYSDVTNSKTIGPQSVGRLSRCSHTFHLLCLLAMYSNGNKVQTVCLSVGLVGASRGWRVGRKCLTFTVPSYTVSLGLNWVTQGAVVQGLLLAWCSDAHAVLGRGHAFLYAMCACPSLWPFGGL